MGHDTLTAVLTSVVAKGLGFFKEVMVAASFGLSGALDIYVMAFVLIGFPLSVLLNAVQTALIATLASCDRSSPDEGRRLFTGTALITLASLIVLLPIWLLLLLHALPWLASGFPMEKRQGLETALLWLIPYYFLNGFNLLGYGVLQAKGRYLINGLLPSATPIATIFVLLVWSASGDWRTLATALVFGSAIECTFLLIAMHRSGQILPPRFRNVARLKTVVGNALALLPGTIMLAVGPVVEQAISASLGEGTNAALGYGFKLPAALQGILVTAVGITALPYFASLIGQNRVAYCLHSLDRMASGLFAGGLLLAIPLAIFSADIVELFYQRGAFDAAATARVGPIQLAYFAQLPFALVAMLGVKALAAIGRNGLLSFFTIVAVLFQCALAYGLGLRFGAEGIAWAATLVSALLAAASYLTARSSLQQLFT